MQQGVTERQRGPGQACSAGRAQMLCRRELCRRHLFALRDVRSGQINRHFVKTLSRCPKLMTSAISRFRQCPRIITPFRGDSARRLVGRWGSREEGGVVRHGDVRHQVRPDDEGLAPPAGASGSEAFGLGPVDCCLLRLHRPRDDHRGLSSSSASASVPHLRACRPSIAVRGQPVRRDAASAFGLLAPT